MHPQTLWLTSIYESTERERRSALIHRNDVARGEEAPRARESRWVAFLHRQAAPSVEAADPTPVPSAQLGCV